MKNAIHNTEAIVVVSQENMLEKLKHSEVTKSVCKHIYHMTCLCFQYVIIIMPPPLHMSVGLSVGTFLFWINNSKTPSPTYLKHRLHIHHW